MTMPHKIRHPRVNKITIRQLFLVFMLVILLVWPAWALQSPPLDQPPVTDVTSGNMDVGDMGVGDEAITVANDDDGNLYAENQIIVSFKPGAKAESIQALRKGESAKLHRKLSSINAEVWKLPPGLVKSGLEKLRKNPNVLYAEYNYIVQAQGIPNDPGYGGQLYLPYMRTPQAWDYGYGTGNAIVAVLDSGINTGNDDLKGMLVGGYNFVNMTSNYADDYGHGTQVASVVGARVNNSFGIAGIAGKSGILSVKVLNSTGAGTYATMIQGIDYAVKQGAAVINMSIGGRTASTALKSAVDQALASGVVIVAAAGNEGSTALSFPAAYENVIGVGAVDLKGVKMTFSNTGSGLTVMAGGSARVATSSNSFTSANGTSFSAPYVAGLVALLKDAKPSASPADIFNAITSTSLDLGQTGYDTTYGHGLVQMDKAIAALLGQPKVNETTTSTASTTTTSTSNTSASTTSTSTTTEVLSSTDTTTSAVESTTTSGETIVLEPQTSIVQEVSTFSGTFTKKSTRFEHSFTVLGSGTLTVTVSYTGKTAPSIEFLGQRVSLPSQSFQVAEGTYSIVAAGTGGSYQLIVQHPERVVTEDVPKGDLVVPYQTSTWVYLLFLLIVTPLLLYRISKSKQNNLK